MSDKIQFYYNPMSRGRIAHWMLEEVGADYEIKTLDWKKAEHKSPEYLKINPMGKIPAIVHKGVVVTENAAICMYLADAFPNAGLAPAVTEVARGAYYRWIMFSANCIEQAIFDKQYPRAGKVEASHLGYGSLEDVMKTVEGAIANGFVVNNKFSTADLLICSQLGWAARNNQIQASPALGRYLKACSDRPAWKRFNEKAGPIG